MLPFVYKGTVVHPFLWKMENVMCTNIHTIFFLSSALATLVEEYVKTVNTPGMVPSVKRTWDVVTQKKCSVTLANAKATYE